LKNLKNLILSTSLIIASIISITFSDSSIYANSTTKESIFIVDPLIEDLLYKEFIFSTISTFKELRENSGYKFFSLNSPNESIEITSDQNDPVLYINELKAWMKSIHDNQDEDKRSISAALSAAINEFKVSRASEGSSINLIVYDELLISPDEEKIIQSIIDSISINNWEINIIHKYGTSKIILDKYQNWAKWGKGNIYPIVVPDTMELLTDKILEDNAERKLKKAYKGIIEKNSLFQKEIFVSPGSSELEIVVYTANSDGNISIVAPNQPTNEQIKPTNLTITSFSKIWRFKDPVPGRWMFKISDYNSGLLSIYHRNKVDYDILLIDKGPFPTKNSIQLVTNLAKGTNRLISKEAYVELIFDGKISYEMNDNGSKGDAVAQDGYYSMILPDVDTPGEYDISIKYSWPNFGTSISDSTKITFEMFPEIIIDIVNTSELPLNKNISIAIIEILLEGEKYYIDKNEVKWSYSATQNSLDVLLKPIDPIQDGRSNKFEVVLSTSEFGKASMVFRLDSMYKNKKFVMYSDTFVIKTIDKPIEQPKTDIVKEINTVDKIQDQIDEQSQFMIIIFVTLSIIALIILIIAIYLLVTYSTKVDIRGYIYDDKNNLILDMKSVKRSLQNRILRRNKIKGSELNDDLLSGLEFTYMKEYLILTNYSDHSVRINNQPLTENVEIFSKAWIGIQGKILFYSEEIS
jgi:hypothetical protein